MEAKKQIFLPTDLIKNLLSRSSKDDNRTALCGICIDLEHEKLVVTDGHRLATRTLDVDSNMFPPWKNVIPTDDPVIEIDLHLNKKSGILFVLKKRFGKEDLVLTLGTDNLKITANDSDGKTEVTVACTIKTNSSDFDRIKINAQYLLDALLALYDRGVGLEPVVTLEIRSDLDPIAIRNDRHELEVVMPKRV